MDNFQDSGNNSPKKGERKTIAYFSGSPGSIYNFEKWQIWRGIAKRAKELDVNLLYITGEEFLKFPEAVLYDLVGEQNVDGILFWNSFTSPRMESETIAEFIKKYEPLPVVGVEREVAGCASILVDNRQGTRELIVHLTVDHGYRHIGYIHEETNITSEVRRDAFIAEMSRMGYYDAELVGSLDQLEARGKLPGVDYQALIVHSDYEAVEIIEHFQRRGLRVPEDVAVVGFNDGRDARGAFPPLTTVRIPFRRMGDKAVDTLMDMIAERAQAPAVVFPMYLMLRRSCGCLEPLAEHAVVGPPCSDAAPVEEVIQKKKNEIVMLMADGLGSTAEMSGWDLADEIFDTITGGILSLKPDCEAPKSSREVLRQMYDLMQKAESEGLNVSRWHDAVTILRRSLIPSLKGEVLAASEDLFQQIRVLVGQSAMRLEMHRNWISARRSEILRDIESALLISFDSQDLVKILTKGLQRLGIDTFYLVLYEGPVSPDGMARLALAFRNGQAETIEADAELFPLRTFLPVKYLETAEPFGMVIEALHLREEQIGYIIFQTDPPVDVTNCEIYKALQIKLSSALKGVRLRERLSEALKTAEEANQLKSRFLSMVSHELRTPLNLIVGLSEMAMRQQNKGSRQSPEILRKYNEQIYMSGQHLDRLIRDVLDLASSQVGQMKLIYKAVDLGVELREAAEMGEQLAGQKKLEFRVSIPEGLPLIWGDKTRIRQVLLNLLSNAVKFTAHGEVALCAEETAEGIHIVVSDTGLGISRDDQDKIFDEFQQSDRSVGMGYGGIGLGLAITRRLIEMHGGRIWVSSPGPQGCGSTFEILLPLMSSGLIEPPSQTRQNREGEVLILSSQEGPRDELSEHLKRQGFRVEKVLVQTDAFDLDAWHNAPPGAIVLDMAPAAEIGWEIMKRFKEDPATQDIPVLFYSLMADQDSGTVVEMDYLNKPVGMGQLLEALKRHGVRSNRREQTAILIVDDEPGILEMHSQIVRTSLPECKILTARDGVHALDIMRAVHVDLVLLDLIMPDLDGFGVIKAMQEEHALRGIPVVVLSGQVLTKRDMCRLNQGVAAVLGKGLFSSQEVFERISTILARSQKLGSDGQRLVFQALGYIHENYKTQISRADIAGNLNVNEQYLSRCFNKEIGIGPMAYLSRYRIEQAKRLLEEGRYSITQVALEVGLSSQSYFSRIFQQETGISPTAYQRRRHN